MDCSSVWGCDADGPNGCTCNSLSCDRRRKLSDGEDNDALLEGPIRAGRELKNVNAVRAHCQTALKAAAKILNNNFNNRCVGTFSKI